MSIKYKILIVIVSSLLIVFFTIYDKFQSYQKINDKIPLYTLGTKVPSLIFELQKERGLSIGYINGEGTTFLGKLNRQRKNTDLSLTSFIPLLKSILNKLPNKTVSKKLNNLENQILKLSKIRNITDKKSQSNIIFGYYSNLISDSLEIIKLMAMQIDDIKILNLINSYTTLLKIQENAGKERALISMVLTSHKMDLNTYYKITGYIFNQENLFKEFIKTSPEKYGKILSTHLIQNENNDLNKFRASIISKGQRDELLNEIQNFIGYGGLIHAFKNYLLRFDEKYAKQVHFLANKTLITLDKLHKINGLTKIEHNYIQTIANTIKNYQNDISIIQNMKSKNENIKNIDKAIRINDKPALEAIQHLQKDIVELDSNKWFEISTSNINYIYKLNNNILDEIKLLNNNYRNNSINKTINYLILYIFLAIVLLLVILIIFKRVVGEIIKISDLLSNTAKSDEYKIIPDVQGNDEITVLENAYNSLVTQKKKAEKELNNNTKQMRMILDMQDNIVLSLDKTGITFANKKFFNFLGYKNLKSFKKNHLSIYELFIDSERYFYPDNNSKSWIREIELLPVKQRIVAMMGPDFHIHAFSVSINKFNDTNIVSLTDISQTMLEQIRLEEKTILDKLTGAYNREYFEQNYKKLLLEYEQLDYKLGVALLDIDHFKIVNDTFGHDVGDYVLQHFVNVIHKYSRSDDILIRWGGEEFIILLKVKSQKDLNKALEHLRTVIELEKFDTVGHKTCSIGASIYIKDEEIEKTIKRADEAVYTAKNEGRNMVVIK